jgi:putative membrane protein
VVSDRDPRVYFAAERTMLAWIRTGLAMMGFGFVVARFGLFLRELGTMQPPSAPHANGHAASLWAGTALVLLGVFVNIYAATAHARFSRRFHAGEREPHDPRFGITLASVLSLIGVALAVYLVVRG